MITDRRAYGEFMPIQALRGELCDLLVQFDHRPPLTVWGHVLWVEESHRPADCELIEFAPIVGVLTTARTIEAQTIDRVVALTAPNNIGLWVRLLSNP